MSALSITHAATIETPLSWLRAVGTIGAVLALVILGTSMFLRLNTIFGMDDQAISTLSAQTENIARMAHRLAASAVGLLALCVAVTCWVRRPLPSSHTKPISLIIAATIFLTVIGPLTPGYRLTIVTVGNVVGGMLLLMAFWWLRASAGPRRYVVAAIEPTLPLAISMLLFHVGTGAAASALEMRDLHRLTYLHLGTALLATTFIGASLWGLRADPANAGWSVATASIMVTQLALGCALMWVGSRPTWLAFLHGMLSPLLAIALVSLASSRSVKRDV